MPATRTVERNGKTYEQNTTKAVKRRKEIWEALWSCPRISRPVLFAM